jgi:hypothetical protein
LNPVLASLLLDLRGLSDEEALELTYQEYVGLYMDRKTDKGMVGIRKTNDGQSVIFYQDRFEHAFFTSAHRTSRQYAKDKFQIDRAARVRWIGQVIEGNIPGTECWYISSTQRYHSNSGTPARLYVLWDEKYLVWLEPWRKDWWFSIAYVATRGKAYIANIVARGAFFWRKKHPVISRLTGLEAKSQAIRLGSNCPV